MDDSALDDQRLMLRFQDAGDGLAFQALFARHKEALLAYMQRLSGRNDVAEDVSQQAWLKLLEVARRREYRAGGAAFRTFLFTLARNHYVDHHVRAHHASRTQSLSEEHEVLPNPDEQPEHAAAAGQVGEAVIAALGGLPHEQRDVIALWSMDVDIDTIASIVDAPRDTVLSRKKYALSKLRQALERLGIGEA